MKEQLFELRERWEPQILEVIDDVVGSEPCDDSSLAEMCRYHVQTGGKRLRAIVPLAVADTLGADPAEVLPLAAACELLHNATLVHDDLQDGDETRRGESTVWKKYTSERAINLGDAMLHWPFLLADRLECADSMYRRVVRRMARQTLKVIDGQDREFLLTHRTEGTWEAYFRMVEGKTGGLFVLPTAGAAELAGADEAIVDAVANAANQLGVLFQIQDDVLDLYGEKGRDHRGMDLCEGKVSALAVHFLDNAPEREAEWLRGVLDAPRQEVSLEDIDRAAEAYREHGSLDAALDEIDRRRSLALEDPRLADVDRLRDLLTGIADLFLEPISHVIEARRTTP